MKKKVKKKKKDFLKDVGCTVHVCKSADSDKMAPNDLYHQDLHYLSKHVS